MTTAIDEGALCAGALVWANLRPTKVREQEGVRPVVVLTDVAFHQRNATAIVCPVTRNTRPWPTKVMLPDGLPITGAILADQVQCLDRAARGFRYIGVVPNSVLADIRLKIAVLIGALPADIPFGSQT